MTTTFRRHFDEDILRAESLLALANGAAAGGMINRIRASLSHDIERGPDEPPPVGVKTKESIAAAPTQVKPQSVASEA